MRIALIAGEASGDLLGGAMIGALRARFPDAEFYGVAGPKMREAGCVSIASIDELSVMGLAEVLPKLLGILKLRRRLQKNFLHDRPDVVIGIDAPDFNLTLERSLRHAGLRTVQVVSPTVWAWRAGRVKSISESVDLLLCLFPFEPDFYARRPVRPGFRARFIGHPLAESLAVPIARDAARRNLDLPIAGSVLAILPGSRGSEIRYLAESFVRTAAWLAEREPTLRFVLPIAKPTLRAELETAIARYAPGLNWHLLDGQSREAMCAADAVLLASGTATLECLLLDRPMVVSYRVSPLTAIVFRSLNLLKIERFSLPNLLCEQPVVPEFLQEAVQPENMGPRLLDLLSDAGARARQLLQFEAVRSQLKQDAAAQAATAIAELMC